MHSPLSQFTRQWQPLACWQCRIIPTCLRAMHGQQCCCGWPVYCGRQHWSWKWGWLRKCLMKRTLGAPRSRPGCDQPIWEEPRCRCFEGLGPAIWTAGWAWVGEWPCRGPPGGVPWGCSGGARRPLIERGDDHPSTLVTTRLWLIGMMDVSPVTRHTKLWDIRPEEVGRLYEPHYIQGLRSDADRWHAALCALLPRHCIILCDRC